MSEAAEQLKPLLDALNADERAEVLDYLHSLDKNGDHEDDDSLGELDPEYIEEINRRVADFEAGKTKLIPGEEVMRRLKEKYG